MGRKRTKVLKPGETAPISFRLDAELSNALDAEAEREMVAKPGLQLTRAAMLRILVTEALAARAKRSK
jgi:hypothetical protein